MASPEFLTYVGDPDNGINPYRPGVNDVGGAEKENDQQDLPDPRTMLDARDWNELSKLTVAHGQVVAFARIYVKFSGGTPSIFAFLSVNTELLIGDFTVTDNGAGDTTIACPATKLPQPTFTGGPYIQQDGDFRGIAFVASATSIRVKTRNAGGSLADADFVVDWI